MIDKGEGDRIQKQQQRDNLREVIQYCENKVDCRRQLVLQYFGERFDKSQCNRTCDNCERATKVTIVDRTDYAIKALKLSEALPDRHTLNQLVDMFKGSTAKRYAQLQDIPFYGAAADLSKTEAERILQNMLTNQVFATVCKSNAHGFVSSYLKTGPKAKDLLSGKLRITLSVCEDEYDNRESSGGGSKNANKRSKTSTASTATVKPKSNVIEDEEFDDNYEDYDGDTFMDEYDLEDSFVNDASISYANDDEDEEEEEEEEVYASSEHELPERAPSPSRNVVNKLPQPYRQILDRGLGADSGLPTRMVILDDDDDDGGEEAEAIVGVKSIGKENMNHNIGTNEDADVTIVSFDDGRSSSTATNNNNNNNKATATARNIKTNSNPPRLASLSPSLQSSMTLVSATTVSPAANQPSSSSDCYQALLVWRDSLAMSRKVNAAFILSNSVIGCIARNLPCTAEELAEIPGMTPERCEKYSQSILQITQRHNSGQ